MTRVYTEPETMDVTEFLLKTKWS